MAIYYLPTRPETVVSIVQTGMLPKDLPEYVVPKQLLCFNDFASSLCASQTSIKQTFILKLQVPFRFSSTKNHSLILEHVASDWIQNIIVVSKPAELLLARLFNYNCPKAIAIEEQPGQPKNKVAKKRKHDEVSGSAPNKSDSIAGSCPTVKKKKKGQTLSQEEWEAAAKALDDLSDVSQTSSDQEMSVIGLRRLATLDEHIDLLRYALKTAKRSLLITSLGINKSTLKDAGLYGLIHQARRRQVKIYIYCNDQSDIDPDILLFFDEVDVFFAQTYTHSKILAMDNNLVAVGSCNWLAAIDPRYPPNAQGSISFSGEEICTLFIKEIWKHIKNYRNEQYGHHHRVRRFESNPDNMWPLCYVVESTQMLAEQPQCVVTYLATLSAHRDYFREVFEKAQQNIIVCSPFISSAGTFIDDFERDLLYSAVSRGVKLFFICLLADSCFETLGTYLDSISPNIILLGTEAFHNKTIICDGLEIAEGSFNSLSATRERDSQYHNHEATIVVEGSEAKQLIAHFYNSNVGQTLLRYFEENQLAHDFLLGSSQQSSQTSVFSTTSSLFSSSPQSKNDDESSRLTSPNEHINIC